MIAIPADHWMQDQQATHQRNEVMVCIRGKPLATDLDSMLAAVLAAVNCIFGGGMYCLTYVAGDQH